MKEILHKLRKYEIRIRKAINSQMQGDFHSVFKGSGLEFDDVRAYQYGDDVRHIDWNVSAKGHGVFIKTFKEEKEQNVFFMLDVSASEYIGKTGRQKIDIAKEICGVLAMSAIKENSSAGLYCFSDERECYVRPHKGLKQSYALLNAIFKLQPRSRKTNLERAIAQVIGILQRRSVIILISDFVDTGYEQNLRAMAHKHDLVVIQISDERETAFPQVGIVPLYEKESGRTVWVNTSMGDFRSGLDGFYEKNRAYLQDLCQRSSGHYVHVTTDEDYVPKLIKLFKFRNRIRK